MPGPPPGHRGDRRGARVGLTEVADGPNRGIVRPGDLATVLLSEGEAAGMTAFGGREAAVLVPVRERDGRTEILFTERPEHLEKHAGEISFPGGKVEPGDRSPLAAALREAEEEVGLAPDQVEVVGALAPVGTFVTSFRIRPFVGILDQAAVPVPDPSEVAAVLGFGIEELAEAYGMRRLVRRGVPIRTPTFTIGDHMIWGATARILTDLMRRAEAL